MRLKSIFILTLLSIFLTNINAQKHKGYYPKPAHPNWFKTIPLIDDSTPEWAITMYTDDANFVKIQSLKSKYYKDHKWEKNIHVQNYKHWFRIVNGNVDDNGRVAIPDPAEEFQKYERSKNTSQASTRSNSANWVNIGPNNTYSNGNSRPTQANVYCLGVSESNPSTIYAGLETGGIFKSTDKGITWNASSWDYAISSSNDIKVDPLDENTVYVVSHSQIYKTVDGGVTWSLLYSSTNVFEQLYIDSDNTDNIYAATREGILKSTDGGATWTNKYNAYVYDIEAKPGSNDTLYVSIKNDVTLRPEILISYDSGENWTLKDNGFYSPTDLSVANVIGCKIGVTPADPDRIYAAIIANGKQGDNGWIGVYHSLDIGETWVNESGVDGASIDNGDGTWSYPSGTDMNTNWYVAGYSSGYHQGWYNFDMDVSETDPDKLWVGTIWVLESANKGANLENVRSTRSLSMHADVQDIEVVGNDIWWASDGGVNYSNDECQTMETRIQGISGSNFWGFGQGWNEDVWTGGRYHNGDAAYHESYGVGNTMFLGGAESPTGYVNQINNKKLYFSDINDKLIPEDINGSATNITNLGLYPTQSYSDFSYSEIEWHPNKANTVYVGKTNQLHISTDGGANFSPIYTFAGNIRRFEISRDDPNYIYAIINYTYWDWKILRSTDGGVTFSELVKPTLTDGSWRNLSFTLNPFDKDEIWLASNSSSNGNKIFSSTDGGSNWTNRYAAKLADQNIKDMIYHASPEGDKVYTMTNDNFFVYDIDLATWESFNNGLPILPYGFMILPFYRDGKIRMASSKGIWETTFAESSTVQAIPMINKDTLLCPRDTAQLESYSIINPIGATWSWSITPTPSYISDTNTRNPQVVFGSDGDYDISLTITSADGQTDTRTVENMVKVYDYCQPDTIAGKSLKTIANGDYVVIPDANLKDITHFTITGWWKPNGPQQAFSAIVSSGNWCASCDNIEGLIYDYHGSKLWYRWPGSGSWASNSGMVIPSDEWSYVALVITPDGGTLYLNEDKYVHNKTLLPGDITNLYIGYGHYSKSFKGEIDEVTIWNEALTDDEVRKLRHITKEDEIEQNPNLISYYQFNNLINGTNIVDKAGVRHGTIHANTELVNSTAPIGGGSSTLVELAETENVYDFPNQGAKLYLSDCDITDGQVVVSKLNVNPDTLANNYLSPEHYWIINHYSENDNFGNLDSIELTSTDADFNSNLSIASDAVIHTRAANSFGDHWVTQSKATALASSTMTFDRKAKITGGTQLSISKGADIFTEIDPGSPCEVDTIPGRALEMPGNAGDYVEVPALDLNTNTFTMSAWIKPDGAQNDWAAIFFCRAGSTLSGLSMRNNNELRYHWNGQEYQWSSGAYVNLDEWNHVAMVIEPNQMTIYLNGIAYTRVNNNHAAEAFDGITRIGNDSAGGARTFDGQIDEVCIWNRILTQDEIRSLRHLTKNHEIENDPDLVLYLQFNEIEGKVYDKTDINYNSILKGNVHRVTSSVPVGGGNSEAFNITGATTISSVTGVDLTFGSTGTYPDGEIVISRINVEPDTIPATTPVSSSYWIINNYGNNQTFSSLENMKFKYVGNMTPNSIVSEYTLASRAENDFGLLWTDEEIVDAIDFNITSTTLSSPLQVDHFGQFIIDNRGAKGWIGVEDTDWNNSKNWGGGIIPIPTDEVVIPPRTPFHPEVELDVYIQSLLMQPGSYIKVKPGNILNISGE